MQAATAGETYDVPRRYKDGAGHCSHGKPQQNGNQGTKGRNKTPAQECGGIEGQDIVPAQEYKNQGTEGQSTGPTQEYDDEGTVPTLAYENQSMDGQDTGPTHEYENQGTEAQDTGPTQDYEDVVELKKLMKAHSLAEQPTENEITTQSTV